MSRNADGILIDLEIEVNSITRVPTLNISDSEKVQELNLSCCHIISLFQEMLEHDKMLLERLKHSESERFSSGLTNKLEIVKKV